MALECGNNITTYATFASSQAGSGLSAAPWDPFSLILRTFWWNDAKDGLWPMLTKVTPASATSLYKRSSLSMSSALVASSISTSLGLLSKILHSHRHVLLHAEDRQLMALECFSFSRNHTETNT